MNFTDVNIYLNMAALIIIMAGAFAFFKTKVSDSTIKNYQESVSSLNIRLNTLSRDLADALVEQKRMGEEIKILKTIPLESIMSTLQSVLTTQNTILVAQNKILHHLETQPVGTTINNNK